jgi:hypothetical protein
MPLLSSSDEALGQHSVAQGYTRVPSSHWEAFASLVLQAAYEATMSAAVLNAQRGASNVVLLTQLGGGAFGNHDDWIHVALRRALEIGGPITRCLWL